MDFFWLPQALRNLMDPTLLCAEWLFEYSIEQLE
jgi:hypothetical protein